jgi:hypothetical protein
MMQLTNRDEQMIEWLSVVRMADIDGIRWALAGLKHGYADQAVTVRRANQWIARMAEVGLVDRVRPMYRDRQIVWPTHLATGRSGPILFRQTMRHELAVAAVSARYLARGFTWARDRASGAGQSHEADGVATRGEEIEVIEVELTVKKLVGYRQIHADFGQRLSSGAASRVVYVCTPEVARTVAREADRFVFRDQRPRLVTLGALTAQGKWIDADGNFG